MGDPMHYSTKFLQYLEWLSMVRRGQLNLTTAFRLESKRFSEMIPGMPNRQCIPLCSRGSVKKFLRLRLKKSEIVKEIL
jgi:hypothetical protein